jgi:hypothetical protein
MYNLFQCEQALCKLVDKNLQQAVIVGYNISFDFNFEELQKCSSARSGLKNWNQYATVEFYPKKSSKAIKVLFFYILYGRLYAVRVSTAFAASPQWPLASLLSS